MDGDDAGQSGPKCNPRRIRFALPEVPFQDKFRVYFITVENTATEIGTKWMLLQKNVPFQSLAPTQAEYSVFENILLTTYTRSSALTMKRVAQ